MLRLILIYQHYSNAIALHENNSTTFALNFLAEEVDLLIYPTNTTTPAPAGDETCNLTPSPS
ncbi:MAG: hypothetical protein KME21_00240 [Desmonostoc vinosum HA7617-LM4]|nr:hypothetical protein [Desmonostoc vinosum HA7617-LM4]